jgi:hypothetical protein
MDFEILTTTTMRKTPSVKKEMGGYIPDNRCRSPVASTGV